MTRSAPVLDVQLPETPGELATDAPEVTYAQEIVTSKTNPFEDDPAPEEDDEGGVNDGNDGDDEGDTSSGD